MEAIIVLQALIVSAGLTKGGTGARGKDTPAEKQKDPIHTLSKSYPVCLLHLSAPERQPATSR